MYANTPFGKPRKRCLDDFEDNLKEMRVSGWRNITRGKGVWRLILKETTVLPGPYRQCRREEETSEERRMCIMNNQMIHR